MRRRPAPTIFDFPPGTKTTRVGNTETLRAYRNFLLRNFTGDPYYYPSGYRPLVYNEQQGENERRLGTMLPRQRRPEDEK